MSHTINLNWVEQPGAVLSQLRRQWRHRALQAADLAFAWQLQRRDVDVLARTREAIDLLRQANVIWPNANGCVTVLPVAVRPEPDRVEITISPAQHHCLRCGREMERNVRNEVVCAYCGVVWTGERNAVSARARRGAGA